MTKEIVTEKIELTRPMLDAAEEELLAHLSGELGPNWPFARLVAQAVVQAALHLREHSLVPGVLAQSQFSDDADDQRSLPDPL
jgi:hypothetical protein